MRGGGGGMAPKSFTTEKKKGEKERKGKGNSNLLYYFLNIMSKYIPKLDFRLKSLKILLARSARLHLLRIFVSIRHIWPPQFFRLIAPLNVYKESRDLHLQFG